MGDAPSDMRLLREFVQTRSESAFAELVARHVNMVYASALRQVRQPQAAEDVTQDVFAMLASKAPTLLDERILPSWLLSATRYTSLDLLKKERRRKCREQKAARMRPDVIEPGPTAGPSDELFPLLDAALAHLSESDRSTVILKFFSGTSDRDAAEILGVAENALRQRRFRSLEKMRAFFRGQGVSVGAELLAGALTAGAMQPAPPHLAAAAVKHALATGGVGAAGIKGLLIMSWVKTNVVAVATVVALLLAGTALLVAGHIGKREPAMVLASPQTHVAQVTPPSEFFPGQQIPALAYSAMRGGQNFPGGLGYLDTGTSVKYANVDFGDNAASFRACLAVPADHAGKQIVVRTDAPDGPVAARLTVQSTGGWGHLAVQSTRLSSVHGKHDVYLSFTGSGVANLYWLCFPAPDTFVPSTQPSGSHSAAQ